jgi:cell division septum initiation protein DivIVA
MTGANSDQELTPELVRSVTFSATRFGRRGIDEAEVSTFCQWVSGGLARLQSDNSMLQAEITRLRAHLLDGTGKAGLQPGDAAELTYLRTFSDVCPTHLRAYMESLTRSIEEREQAERHAAVATRNSVTNSA